MAQTYTWEGRFSAPHMPTTGTPDDVVHSDQVFMCAEPELVARVVRTEDKFIVHRFFPDNGKRGFGAEPYGWIRRGGFYDTKSEAIEAMFGEV